MLEAPQNEVTVALPFDRLPWMRLLLYAVVLRQHPAELASPAQLSQGVTRLQKKLMERDLRLARDHWAVGVPCDGNRSDHWFGTRMIAA